MTNNALLIVLLFIKFVVTYQNIRTWSKNRR